MIIGFLSNKLTLRGTEVCIYDYADFSEKILGHKSIIITRPFEVVMQVSPRDVRQEAYDKFKSRFAIEYYVENHHIVDIVRRNKIDVLFIEKAGYPGDGLVFNCCKTIIHAVFTLNTPHGTMYTSISHWLNKHHNTNYPVLPYMIRIDETTEDLRAELKIPKDAWVFGSYSGADEFNIDYVKDVVSQVGTDPAYPSIYFIFLNIDRFGPPSDRIKFLPGTADMKYKRMFINTCDAMIYGRNGGETFGLACGEFACSGKLVIARKNEHGNSHEELLGDAMIPHSSHYELFKIITTWSDYVKHMPSSFGYKYYSPKNVMENFQKHLNML
jgi:hypothetical protein